MMSTCSRELGVKAGCVQCGGIVPPNRGPGRPRVFCSEACRKRKYAHPCADCGQMCDVEAVRCVTCAVVDPGSRLRSGDTRAGRVRWSDDALLDAIRSAGGRVTVAAYEAWRRETPRPLPSAVTIMKRWGRWTEAVAAAGCEPGGPRRNLNAVHVWSAPEAVAAVRELHAIMGGVPPTMRAYSAWRASHSDRASRLPSAATVRNVCGSWNAVTRTLLAEAL